MHRSSASVRAEAELRPALYRSHQAEAEVAVNALADGTEETLVAVVVFDFGEGAGELVGVDELGVAYDEPVHPDHLRVHLEQQFSLNCRSQQQ